PPPRQRQPRGFVLALTDTAARTAKPRKKLYRLTDNAGLCLEITPGGSKLWRFRYRLGGKAKMMGLFAYPTVTLAKARERREDARQRQRACGVRR
ncbi:Integrase, partial [Pseudomonas amygdali]